MDIDDIDLKVAAERVGDRFELEAEGGAAPLSIELTEVEPLSAAPDGASGFSMLFRGPAEPLLNQSIRELRDDRWGTTELFLVPIGRDDAGAYYEAVVNRPS